MGRPRDRRIPGSARSQPDASWYRGQYRVLDRRDLAIAGEWRAVTTDAILLTPGRSARLTLSLCRDSRVRLFEAAHGACGVVAAFQQRLGVPFAALGGEEIATI